MKPRKRDFNMRRRVDREKRQALEDALEEAGGVRKAAAYLLGIDQRNLPYYLRKHGLSQPR